MNDLLGKFNNLQIRKKKKKDIKIKKNRSFLKELLQATDCDFKVKSFDKPFHLEPVDVDKCAATRDFEDTMTSPKGAMYSINKIFRVENTFLFLKFRLKEETKHWTTVEYFHGTPGKNIYSICKDNFNWRLNGLTQGHKFGQGVSFSPRSDYSKHSVSQFIFRKMDFGKTLNSSISEMETYAMFYVSVLKLHEHIGNHSTIIPANNFDTTCNEKQTVFVKYDDYEFYPEYLLLLDKL